jgi:hypothetical protein
LKLLTKLLIRGLSNAKTGVTFSDGLWEVKEAMFGGTYNMLKTLSKKISWHIGVFHMMHGRTGERL